ncbi:hypothetical protein PYW07_003034 [Mythimna separata]|uniref:tRNA (34-2'-O)-methyltransferase regulator WDR6 n=1 Tax=Mythimna separata TaxID=271217 RepID=A0AAD7YHC6_MYTSE|nr:hypothetical protein PYW07_003034 [Mythimna separata]
MSLLTRTDVTAVKFHRNLVLAGIGSTVNIFDKASTKLLQRLSGLKGQKIYGFVPAQCGDIILVFGGKQFTVIFAETSEHCGDERGVYSRIFEPVVCDDWLHSAVWVDDEQVALLTAHNVVQKWNTRTQTLLSQHTSRDNSILYSGLLLPLQGDMLVMAGTVFSQVIIHRCSGDQPLHHLRGHKGVIFSISCEPQKNIIVTTSDDRSVRIWGPNTTPTHPHNTADYWETIDIVCKHEVYGHLARVMRSCITSDIVVSVGEDSAICYWSYEGKLLKKALTHQNGCIWSVDSDGHVLVTGGGDCGVILHPLSIATDYSHDDIIDIGVTTPKKVVFTARKNIIVMDENNLIYYDVLNKNKTEHKLNHESTYKLLSLSTCKQLVAVADMNGKLDVFVEKCKDEAFILNVIDTKLQVGKILSMHWAGNRHLILCSGDGQITVLASNGAKVEDYANFDLPNCKERWLTAAAVNVVNNSFVVGDRCGNVHVFVKGQRNPVKSFPKVHGRYGPTSINVKNNNIITTGRDGTIKYFSINDDTVKYMSSKDLAFDWVEKFLDKGDNIVCGFQERAFVVHNIKDNSKILEVPCGGGHRSWDAVRYFEKVNENYEEFIKLIYLKNSDINVTTFQLSKIVSRNMINGSHAKEINCLKAHKVENATVYVSGGEDTTLRISSVDTEMNFKDEVCFKHLSSVRTLKTFPLADNRLLVLSAGGRAQLCIKDIKLTEANGRINVSSEELIDYQIKGTDKERKGNQTWRNCSIDFDPEMRIMDLDLVRDKDSYIIFAGCSDSYLRVFSFKQDSKKVEYLKESKYHKTCILKTKIIRILKKYILITCTTRGDVTFWDITSITKSDFQPFFSTKTNKSGINSIDTAILTENKILITTGGDDNAIHINVLEIPDQNDLTSTKVLYTWNSCNCHSSQITGLCLVDDYLLSTSIDQRITLLRWGVSEEGVDCKFLSQTHTDVADVQGMELLDHNSGAITVCVFGKGMEVIVVSKDPVEPSVTPVVTPVTYGTGPHWCNRTQSLYYVSTFGKTLLRYADGSHFKTKLNGLPTFIIPIEGKEQHFAVGLGQKVLEVQWDGGVNGSQVLRTIAEVRMAHPEDRFSHGKADPRGRLFAGTRNPAWSNKNSGSLYRFAEDGTPQKVLDNIEVSNGFCWDLARKAFYIIDNSKYSIRRYDYDVETGDISNPRIVFSMQDQEYVVDDSIPCAQDTAEVDPVADILGPNYRAVLGAPQDDIRNPPVGRTNQKDPYGLVQSDPSEEIEQNLGGLLDRDDYYDTTGSRTSSGDEDTPEEDDEDAGGERQGDVPGASEEEAEASTTGDVPGASEGEAGYEDDAPGLAGGSQTGRQRDLQGSIQGGPLGASQTYAPGEAPGSPQGYASGGPQGYVPGIAPGYAPGAPQQGYAPGGFQGYAPGGPQPQGYAPGGFQGYIPGVPQAYTPGVPQGYAPGGPQGYAPGAPQGYAPGIPQGYLRVGPQAYGPRGYPPVGPGLLRTGPNTAQGYYRDSHSLTQGGPLGRSQGGPQGAPPGSPRGNITGESPYNLRAGGPQDQGLFPSGPQDPHGFTPGGPQGFAPGGPQGFAPGETQGFAPGGPQGFAPGGPQGFAPGGPQGLAPGGPQGLAPGGPQGLAPGGPQGFAPGGPQGLAPGGPQGLAPGGPQGLAPGGPQGFAPGGPQGLAPGGPQGLAPGGPQGVAPGGPQGLAPGGPQGFAPGGPQGFAPGGPQGFAPGGPQVFAPGGPQGFAPLGPLGFAPGGAQGFAPGGPQGVAPGGPQGVAPGGPQGFAPLGPLGFAPGGAQGFAPGGPQGVAPGGPQGVAPGGPQGVAPGGPQGVAPGGPQGVAPLGPLVFAPGGAQSFASGGAQGYAPYGGVQGYAPYGGAQGYAPYGGAQGYAPYGVLRAKGKEKDHSYKKKLAGVLDGMTVDKEGILWVANFNESQVLKIDPKKGKLLLVIPVDARLVTSLTFGGPDLDMLFVTSAATDRVDKKAQVSPAGATFTITSVGVTGYPNYHVRFNLQATRNKGTNADAIKDLT